ncbi:hypothetical protein ACWEKR_32935, partial [Nocardia sp. NPDC004573]
MTVHSARLDVVGQFTAVPTFSALPSGLSALIQLRCCRGGRVYWSAEAVSDSERDGQPSEDPVEAGAEIEAEEAHRSHLLPRPKFLRFPDLVMILSLV